ncbi:MAG TPA: hypothetical protein VK806_11985 [Bacteroidia bacterium]|jgi:hypothetical protein|nr:hypothetical protein [Bacteroidia bacterium]
MKLNKIVMAISLIGLMLIGNITFAQKAAKNDTILLAGKIVKEQFEHNKPVKGVYDYFLQTNDKKYFVKTYKAKYSKADLDKWVGQQVEVNAVIVNGTWDDNGEGQSRGGGICDFARYQKE